ncbi:MAG: hypothetical protein ACP5SA_02410 [Candidatus Micrarchaeia archaeon]
MEKNVGINEILVNTPHVHISAGELAKAVTTKNFVANLMEKAEHRLNDVLFMLESINDMIEASYPYSYEADNYVNLVIERNKLNEVIEHLKHARDVEDAKGEAQRLIEIGVLNNEELGQILKNAYVDPKKIEDGLMIKRITLPSFAEGNATFVADMLYKFIKEVTSNKEKAEKLMKEPIKRIYYSSESNPDRSRPEFEVAMELVSSKLIEEDEQRYRPIISMLRHAMLYPTTYACVGGVMSLDQAARSIGEGESALVISADNAIYDPKLAPNAELTQGAGSVLMWITHDPEIAAINYQLTSSYHLSLSDFTKYFNEHPVVHGKFSEIVYVYIVAKALESSKIPYIYKSEYENSIRTIQKVLDFFTNHVPFPKQAYYFASLLFVHELRNFDKDTFEEIQKRPGVGKEPLNGFSSLTELLDSKFKQFNINGDKKEQDIIEYIENDPDIKKYWEWLGGIRKQPEFKKFIKDMKIDEALVLPSQTGNVYSSAALEAFTSMLVELSKNDEKLGLAEANKAIHLEGVIGGFGSGAQGVVESITINTSKEKLVKNISININTVEIDARQYIDLHKWLTENPEAVRASESGDLFEKTKVFLRREMPDGFYVIRRNIDGTGEYCYVENGEVKKLRIRY